MSDLLRFVIENAEYCLLANVKQHHMLAVRDAAQKEHEEQLQLELQLAQQGYYQQQDQYMYGGDPSQRGGFRSPPLSSASRRGVGDQKKRFDRYRSELLNMQGDFFQEATKCKAWKWDDADDDGPLFLQFAHRELSALLAAGPSDDDAATTRSTIDDDRSSVHTVSFHFARN